MADSWSDHLSYMNTLSTTMTCTFCEIWTLANKNTNLPKQNCYLKSAAGINKVLIKEVELKYIVSKKEEPKTQKILPVSKKHH